MDVGKRCLYVPLGRLVPGGGVSPDGGLMALAGDLRRRGMLQPLTVEFRPGSFLVVSGQRRLAAARIAGLEALPCVPADEDPALWELTEQLSRRDLHYLREAELLREYLLRSGRTQTRAAEVLGMSQSCLANKLRLLRLPEPVRALLRDSGLGQRQARALLRVPPEAREAALREVLRRGLTARETEAFLAAPGTAAGPPPPAPGAGPRSPR